MIDTASAAEPGHKGKNLNIVAQIVYALFLATHFVLGTILAGALIAWLYRPRSAGIPYAAHFSYQLRTFLYVLSSLGLGLLLMYLTADAFELEQTPLPQLLLGLLGLALVVGGALFNLGRTVKGWSRLRKGRPPKG